MSALKVGSRPSSPASVSHAGGGASVKKASAEAKPSAPAFKPVRDGFDRPKAQGVCRPSEPRTMNVSYNPVRAEAKAEKKSPLGNILEKAKGFLDKILGREPAPQRPAAPPCDNGTNHNIHNRNIGGPGLMEA